MSSWADNIDMFDYDYADSLFVIPFYPRDAFHPTRYVEPDALVPKRQLPDSIEETKELISRHLKVFVEIPMEDLPADYRSISTEEFFTWTSFVLVVGDEYADDVVHFAFEREIDAVWFKMLLSQQSEG